MQREFALPGTRPRYAPDRRFDVQHYKIDVDLDVEARRVSGVCTISLTALTPDQRRVALDAVELEVEDVICDGKAVAFDNDGKTLAIELPAAAPVGATLTLEVAYSTRPRRGLYFVGPDEAYPDKPTQVWSQGQDEDSRYWFPCFDSPHEKATSEVIATVPAGFFALSNGGMVGEPEQLDGGRARFHWRFDTPHSCYLITLAAGELSELRERWGDVDVLTYVQPGREAEAQRACGRTAEMLEVFSKTFGVSYPYEKYAQVFVADFIFGGMENTTATTLTDTVLHDERAAIDYDVDDLVAHELAHQWFGDLLTCRDWGHGWLNEGFATYSEYVWRDHAEGRDEAALALDAWGDNYFGEDAGRYRRRVATNLYDLPIDVFDHHLYDKGGRILHMLRQVLGEDGFWRSIGHYLRKHRTGSVETRDLARAVEEATGRVVDWFFDQWVLEGAGHPELEVAYAWDGDAKLARFTVKQTQKVEGDTPLFRLPLKVRFRVGDADRDFELEVRDQQETFYFPLSSAPTQAIFDPGKHVLAQVKMDKGLPLWIAELHGAAEGIDRVYAARQLGKLGGAQAEEALVTALGGDTFWGVRRAAAEALGAIRTETARDALLAAVNKTKSAKARRGVVTALGSFRYDERAADGLIRVIERGDESYFVEAAACLALGKTRSPRAGAVLRGALDRDSFNDVIRQHVYRGLAELRDDEAMGVLTEGTRYGAHPAGRRAALAALADLARGRADRAARDARERAEELLDDPDYRLQAAAIDALATIGSPAAIPALQSLGDRAIDGRLRRRAREVVRDIGSGRAKDEQLSSLRSDLDELRAVAAKLQDRLTKLEAPTGARKPQKAQKPQKQIRRTGGKKTIKA